jgi:CheY-like chemotaxis protein
MTSETRKPGTRVLVADDEELVRTLIGRVAEAFATTVVLVAGGREALAALEASEFDLVITDIRMPIVDGLAVVRWVRSHRPHTRIIAITGFAASDTEHAVAALGAYLLDKPFGARELRDAIEHALSAEKPQAR